MKTLGRLNHAIVAMVLLAGCAGSGELDAQKTPDPLQRCLSRYDEVLRTKDEGSNAIALSTFRAVFAELGERFDVGDRPTRKTEGNVTNRGLRNGFVGAVLDVPRERVLVAVGADVVDRAELEADLDRVAEGVRRTNPELEGRIDVEVVDSCVPSRRLLTIADELLRDARALDLQLLYGPNVDSRLHFFVGTAQAKREAERRWGSLVQVQVGKVGLGANP